MDRLVDRERPMGGGQVNWIEASGVIVTRDSPRKSFLLMRHADRWDLPKGHLEPGESHVQAALRELEEETGIQTAQIELDPDFRYELHYPVRLAQYNFQPRDKRLTILWGRLVEPVAIRVTEHAGYEWFDWNPPHRIQEQTIDPVLRALEPHWR